MLQKLLTLEGKEDRRLFLQSLLKYRKLSKLKTTYVDPLLEAAEPVERVQSIDSPAAPRKAIFCCWNQTHAATGRLSTSLPNLQALPKGSHVLEHDEATEEMAAEEEDDAREGAEEDHAEHGVQAEEEAEAEGVGSLSQLHEVNIRDCFLPLSPSRVLLSADFNQMEMRIMAHCSGDTQLVRFFTQVHGHSDIYTWMASVCFEVEEQRVSKEQRSCAKQLSLGILYGMVNTSKRSHPTPAHAE